MTDLISRLSDVVEKTKHYFRLLDLNAESHTANLRQQIDDALSSLPPDWKERLDERPPVHPPQTLSEQEWFARHAVVDGLTLDRIRSAHSRLPWLARMEDEYGQGMSEGCYICWLIARLTAPSSLKGEEDG